jgi:FkbM family methyltransferase
MLYKKIINRLYKITFHPPDFNRTLKTLLSNQKKICMLDIGANEGQTIDWALNLFESVEIFSFEPTERLFLNLKSKYKNKDIKLYNLALSDSKGTIKFYTSSHSMTNSLLKPRMEMYEKHIEKEIYDDMSAKSEELVEVNRLDDWYDENLNDEKIDILKIDTQGNDFNVLLGAPKLLNNKVSIIIIEIEYLEFYQGVVPFYKIIELLMNSGFYVHSIFDNIRKPDGHLIESNFIFVKNN